MMGETMAANKQVKRIPHYTPLKKMVAQRSEQVNFDCESKDLCTPSARLNNDFRV
jgi:hypothetical protein